MDPKLSQDRASLRGDSRANGRRSPLAHVAFLTLFVAASCSEEMQDPTGIEEIAVPSEPTSLSILLTNECGAPNPAWIWCDDFDTDRLASYFEYDNAGGNFARTSGVGQNGTVGMRATYRPGTPNTGNLKVAFGRSASPGYVRPVGSGIVKFRDVYWRVHVRTQSGWTGGGPKNLSRAMVLANSSWAQAMVARVQTPAASSSSRLQLDPARGTDAAGTLRTTQYNDAANLTSLGTRTGSTSIFSSSNDNEWFCVETHVRLNDAGVSNGVFELWVDGDLEARQTTLNWLGAYDAYGVNAIFFENFWSTPYSPVTQSRYLDNIVVSSDRIGCDGGTGGGVAPVAVVEISGGNAVALGSTLNLTAVQANKDNVTMSGPIVWRSTNTQIATVSSTGAVTGVTAGSTTITAESSNGKRGSVIVTVGAVAGVNISTTILPSGTTAVAYSQTLAATGGNGTYTWAITSGGLPAGLSLSTSTGVISGTPTAAGTSNFTVQATSAAQTDTQALSIAINQPGSAPNITTTSLPSGTQGVAYNQPLSATGGNGTFAWAVTAGTLPAGLTLNASTGAISGTPTTAGTSNFTIRATSVGQSDTQALSITINQPAFPPNITTASLPNGTQGVAYNQPLSATGGNGSFAWAISSGALPGGLTLNASTGQVSGTPTVTGTSSFTVRVTSAGQTATQSLAITIVAAGGGLANECQSQSPAWVWCDDFDVNRLSSYFEIDNAGGNFNRVAAVGQNGSYGMQGTFQNGASNAGSLKLALGLSGDPGYVDPVDGGVLKYRDLYWRMFVRTQAGWTGGGGDKLSRAAVLASSSWAEAAIGHVWTPDGAATNLMLDPVRGTDAAGNLLTTTYNDFAHFTWLSSAQGTTNLFSNANANKWYCVEAHMRLNDAGVSNGAFELRVNGNLEGQTTGMNWLGAYSAHGINVVFFENFWNDGSPQVQSRYFDNIVVSTEPIGCTGGTPGGPNPVAVVQISGGTTVQAGSTLNLVATQKDKTNTTVAGSVTWASTDTGKATVSSSGVVTGVAAGTTTITAVSSNGKRASVIVTVTGSAAPAPPQGVNITTTSLPGAQVAAAYSRTLAATGGSGTYAWAVSSGTLPTGLSLNTSTGVISGVPLTAGTYNFTVRATSVGLSDTQALSIAVTVSLPLPTITTTSLPNGTRNVAYSRTLAATGGDGTFTWSLSLGALPAGLTLNASTGAISGTPTVAGTSSFTVLVTSGGQTDAQILSLTIVNPVSGGGPAPIRDVNFQSYTTTSALRSDCTTFSCGEDENTSVVVLDSGVAPPIAGLTKSMRYDYLHDGNGCNSITIKREVSLPSPKQEVWAEFYVRWSPNFTTANSSCSPNDHKLIFGDTEASLNGRWAFYVGNGGGSSHAIRVERPTASGGTGDYALTSDGGMNAQDLWDGQWHVIRLHMRASTTQSSGDGVLQVWIDGALRHNESGFNVTRSESGPDKIESFSFAHNKDDGPAGVLMSLWWGRIQIFDQNPGW